MRKAARDLLRRARQGDERAMIDLALAYAVGNDELAANPPAALDWLLKVRGPLRDEALAHAGERIPSALLEAAGIADAAMRAALGAGASPRLMRKAAVLYLSRGAPEGVDAVALLERAAAAGDPLATRELALQRPGTSSSAGDEPPSSGWQPPTGSLADQLAHCKAVLANAKDAGHAAAVAHLETLARRGFADAALALARHHEALPGGTARCNAWLLEGAQAGSAEAQEALGLAYLATAGREVDGLPRRWKHAHQWLSAAARQGRAEAAWALYQLHGNRGFAARDPVVRREALARAAELGHAEAAWVLANALGRSAVRDDAAVTSMRWLVRAAGAGHDGAAAEVAERVALVEPRSAAQRELHQMLCRAIARTAPVLSARLTAAAILRLSAEEAAQLVGDELVDATVAVVRLPRQRKRRTGLTRDDLRVLRVLEDGNATAELREALSTIAAATATPAAEDALALEHALYRRGVLWSEFVAREARDGARPAPLRVEHATATEAGR